MHTSLGEQHTTWSMRLTWLTRIPCCLREEFHLYLQALKHQHALHLGYA